MTAINLQDKFSERLINQQPTEREIKNVMFLSKIFLYPGKFINALALIKDMVIVRFFTNLEIRKFKMAFNKANEFSRMDLLAEISFLSESIENLLKKVQSVKSNKRGHYPMMKFIKNMLQSIQNNLIQVERVYHKKIYTDAPDTESADFKEKLKKTYTGFELED